MKHILVLILVNLVFVIHAQSQNIMLQFFNVVNNQYNIVKPLNIKKINLHGANEPIFSFDFNKDGKVEKMYGTRSNVDFRFLIESGDSEFYISDGVERSSEDGIWCILIDVLGDKTPEIVLFSFFRNEVCELKIIKYDLISNSFWDNTYTLNDISLVPHAIVINEKKIQNSYGSQGLFDEISIFEDDFDPRLMYYNLIISNPNFTSRNISIEGKYVGTVPAGDVAVFKVRRKYYGDIFSEQTSGYLFFPTIERRRINRRPSANETIKIVL